MRKALTSQVFFFVIATCILLLACSFPILIDQDSTVTNPEIKRLTLPAPTLKPTYSLLSEPAAFSRCELFEMESLSLFILDIKPGDASVLVYIQFPNKVIGLEDQQHDDGLPWEYSATLGESPSTWCSLFEGTTYSGRLYCMFPLPKEYKNTAQPFVLFINECNPPIFSVDKHSLLVEKSAGSGNSAEHTDQIETICGPEPPDFPACNPTHEQWCSCMGGYYSCELNTVYIPVKGSCHSY